MKDLLKKGDQQKAAPRGKRPLFGSKKPNPDNAAAAQKSKKSLFGAKKAPNARPASQQRPVKGKAMDTSKLVPIFGGLLLLVALAVAAKMFLFKEEPLPPTQPPVAQTPPSPATPAPEATEPVPPPADMVSNDQAQSANLAMTPDSMPAQHIEPVAPADNNSQIAPQPVDGTVAATPPASTQKMTYEEFLQESKTKVYRERETHPASIGAEIAQTETATGQ